MTRIETQHRMDAAEYQRPGIYVDSDSEAVKCFVFKAFLGLAPGASLTEKAIRLFEVVRDDIRYDPYTFAMEADAYRASAICDMESAFCVPKAILLTACLRAAGIPAALGFADVRNHLNTPKLAELMGTDLFIYHGYVQLWLDGKPYKVTPAFNSEMCDRFGVKPLIFDGKSDALFHEYNQSNQRHLEYVKERGLYFDVPIKEFFAAFWETYPKLLESSEKRLFANGAKGVDAGFAPTNE